MNWISIGILFVVVWGILYLLIRTMQKQAAKLKEEKHKSDPFVKIKQISR